MSVKGDWILHFAGNRLVIPISERHDAEVSAERQARGLLKHAGVLRSHLTVDSNFTELARHLQESLHDCLTQAATLRERCASAGFADQLTQLRSTVGEVRVKIAASATELLQR